MIILRILPAVLKELSKHVPAVLFQTVEWSELSSEIPKISQRMLKKEGYESLLNKHQQELKNFHIELTQESLPKTKIKKNSWAGEQILTLYFSQIFSPHGLFLDLRSHHFSADLVHFKWNPSSLWTIFDETFREGLLEVYEGFYLRNDNLYYSGLEKIGLLKKDFDLDDKKILGDLFKAQFGNALNHKMAFDLEHFKSSIIKMSDFMLSRKIKISKDFLYLGIYLVTMYSSLEEIEEELPVKEIYLKVKEHFSLL